MSNSKPQTQTNRIVITAGGTGGHVIPALAIAKELIAAGYEIDWIGGQRLEADLVPKAQIPLHQIQQTGVRQRGLSHWFKLPFSLFQSVREAMRILRKFKPVCVIGFGGYLSVPVGLAAKFLRIPLVIHEQNAKAGLSNTLLRPFTRQSFCAFPKAFSSPSVLVVGNPVRPQIATVPAYTAPKQPFNILIFGGSLGAKSLNEIVPQALKMIPPAVGLSITHQTGETTRPIAEQAYLGLHQPFQLLNFIEDMANAYAQADLVIARAGALTVSEIATAGRPAIFIPYPHAVDDHQTANAQYLVQSGAALCIQEKDLTAESLKQEILNLIQSPSRLSNMACKARELSHQNALLEMTNWIKAVFPID